MWLLFVNRLCEHYADEKCELDPKDHRVVIK